MTKVKYYFENGTHAVFDKYTIDTTGIIFNKKTGKIVSYFKSGKYNRCGLTDNDGKKRKIRVARAIASTFIGPPPTPAHTADHIDRNPDNDTLHNIRWICKKGQINNQQRPENYKSAFIIIKDGDEKTVQEWVDHFIEQTNAFGREYTTSTIKHYAERKQHGFAYKEYPDLPDEMWKQVKNSSNNRGHWEISNMSRIKYITKHAENVLYGTRLRLDNGYPTVYINGKHHGCHILAFKTFFPDDYAAMKTNEIILHEADDRLDFRPHNLRIGTASDNTTDAHNNGRYIGKQNACAKCSSYINGIFEKEHDSQRAAARYLKSAGFEKATDSKIYQAINAFRSGEIITRYGRTWRPS